MLYSWYVLELRKNWKPHLEVANVGGARRPYVLRIRAFAIESHNPYGKQRRAVGRTRVSVWEEFYSVRPNGDADIRARYRNATDSGKVFEHLLNSVCSGKIHGKRSIGIEGKKSGNKALYEGFRGLRASILPARKGKFV